MEPVKYSSWILERIAIGEVIRLRVGKNTVGRFPTSTVKVNSSFSSRCHCQLIVNSNATINLRDFSSNGTFVNNEQYKNSTVLLSDGDRIGIGCNVTDEQCMDEIYVMYILRYRPLAVEPPKSNVLPEQVPKVKNDSSSAAVSTDNNASNKPTEVVRVPEEEIPKSSIAILKDVDKRKNESDHCKIDDNNTNNGKDSKIKTEECSSAKNKRSGSTAQAETIAPILEIIDLSSDVECEDDTSKKIEIKNSPSAENTSTDGAQVFDLLKSSEEKESETTKRDLKRKSSFSSKTQNKRRKSSGNEKSIEKPTENSSNDTKLHKRKSHQDVQPQSCKNRRKSCVSEIAQSSDSRENNNNESYLTGSSSSKEIVTGERRQSSISDKRRKSNRDKSPPIVSHIKEKPEKSEDLNHRGAKRKSLTINSTENSKISTDNAINSEPVEKHQSFKEETHKSNNDKMTDNKISENKTVSSGMAIDDDDLAELEDFIDNLKSDLNESVDDEVYEISDDEEMNFHISQSFIRDIKKEYVDLELEEDANAGALPEIEEDKNKITVPGNDNAEPFIKVESPMFEDDDDSEDDYDDTVTNWVLKLSQSVLSETKVDSSDDVDSAFDGLVKTKDDKISEEIEEKIDYKISDKDRSGQTHKALPGNAAVKKIEKIRPAIPEVIEPPSLPTKKGKLRGVSAQSPSNNLYKNYLNKRCNKIRAKAIRNEVVKELEDKWRQKPNIDKAKQKADLRKLQEQRKIRLKELADVQANKRKLNDDDEVKIVKTPKVKVTHKNRGAFLTEEPSPEKPMPATAHDRIKLGKIPKRQLSVHDNIQKSILGEGFENKSSEEDTLIDESLHNRIDTITALKIKTRTARTSLGVLLHDEKFVETALAKESRNDNSLQQLEPVPKETVPTEKNIVHVESSIINASLKSILKPLNNLKVNVRSIKKKVQFKEKHEVRYFQIENDSSLGRKVDTKDVPVDFTPFVEKTPSYRRKIQRVVDYTEMTLSDMLSWKPRWFDTHTEEVNGPGHVLLPMLQIFPSFEDFAKVVFPLMKLEVWAMIEREYQFKMKFPSMVFKIESRHLESRHGKPRMVFYIEHCMNVKTAPLYSGEFGEAKLEFQKNGMRLFAIISNIRKSNVNSKYYQITLETSYNLANKDIYENAKEIRFRPITQIKVELGAFNAVHHLKQSPLSKLILNPMELAKLEEPVIDKVRYKGCDSLNDNQRDTLLKTYCKIIDRNVSNICLIEGPPGTGKSRVISNLAMQILYGDKAKCLDRKMLICAQSNTAIDVIALKLLEIRGKMERDKFKLVRFGILERMHKYVQSISVQKLIEGNTKPKFIKDRENALDQEINLLKAQITSLSINKNVNNVQQDELFKLRQKLDMVERIKNQQLLKEDEKNLYPKFLQGAHIVCTTLSSCIKLLQHTNYFDICIIDEATQCSEPWSLIPLQFGISSLVLVGDTQQLPATVLSKKTDQYGFGTSLFTRIQRCLENTKSKAVQSLRTQYRMHPEICQWPNSYFYKHFLCNGECTTAYMPVIKPYSILSLEFEQNQNVSNGQILNSLEALFIADLLVNMFKILPPRQFSYGIITPYSDHREKLIKTCSDKGIKEVQISTIDSYQGKEKDVILISNGRTKGIGFLTNSQRLNVAVTRARKCLILCGNFNNLERVPAWKSLLNDAKRRNIFYHINKSDALDVSHKVMPRILIKETEKT